MNLARHLSETGSNAPTVIVCQTCLAEHPAGESCRGHALKDAAAGRTAASAPQIETGDALIGETLGDYRILGRLGSGGMGSVYQAEHRIVGNRVALKTLHPHLATRQKHVERFRNEARLLNLVGHENIVSVFDLHTLPPDRHFLTMELLEGDPLSSLMGFPLEPEFSLRILVQICDALEAAHAVGVVHRDLKPENVLLVKGSDGEPHAKLVDFGIARLIDCDFETLTGGIVGTPEFMAPEQWEEGRVDGRTDLYALGAIAYMMTTGRTPFAGTSAVSLYSAHRMKRPEPPSKLMPELPPGLEPLILRALEKQPEERFQTAGELRDALEAILRGVSPGRATGASSKPKGYAAQASWEGEAKRFLAVAGDAQRRRLVLCGEGRPPLSQRIRLTVECGDERVSVEGEVVGHLTPEQLDAFSTKSGFSLQLDGTENEINPLLTRLAGLGLPSSTGEPPLVDDPEATRQLERYEACAPGDHYALLGVEEDADCAHIRRRARQAASRLQAMGERLSAAQRERADAVLERLHAAASVLGVPAWRAAFDAERGSFRGVAQCLGAGVGAPQLDGLREGFAKRYPERIDEARVHLENGRREALSGRPEVAAGEYERALILDPLNLEGHERYWPLVRARREEAEAASRAERAGAKTRG